MTSAGMLVLFVILSVIAGCLFLIYMEVRTAVEMMKKQKDDNDDTEMMVAHIYDAVDRIERKNDGE